MMILLNSIIHFQQTVLYSIALSYLFFNILLSATQSKVQDYGLPIEVPFDLCAFCDSLFFLTSVIFVNEDFDAARKV